MNNKDGELTEEEYREVIKYGRGMLINIIIGVVAAVVIAVYMGMLKKGVVFLMLLLPLRQYCGGYHMKNHNKCIVASIIIYFLQLMLIKNLKVTISVQIVMLIFALVIILMLAPVDNINNKMNYEEKNHLKKKIRVILIIELFLYAIFIVLSKTDYGLIVVLCIAIVAGLLILGNISNRIGICDDEQLTCSELENYINEIFECKDDEAEIYVWNSGEALKKDISNGVKIDILFLDIELLDSNGIELGKYIRNYMKNMSMNIVYISSMTEYAMELFKIHPYDFVVKPFDKNEIENLIDEMCGYYKQDNKHFKYCVYGKTNMVMMRDIKYFESRGRHIIINLVDNQSIQYVGQLKNEIKKLPLNFVEIGKSYIINLKHMKECHVSYVVMDDGKELGISRAYRNYFNEKILEYNS